jgi:hypothetical protein
MAAIGKSYHTWRYQQMPAYVKKLMPAVQAAVTHGVTAAEFAAAFDALEAAGYFSYANPACVLPPTTLMIKIVLEAAANARAKAR